MASTQKFCVGFQSPGPLCSKMPPLRQRTQVSLHNLLMCIGSLVGGHCVWNAWGIHWVSECLGFLQRQVQSPTPHPCLIPCWACSNSWLFWVYVCGGRVWLCWKNGGFCCHDAGRAANPCIVFTKETYGNVNLAIWNEPLFSLQHQGRKPDGNHVWWNMQSLLVSSSQLSGSTLLPAWLKNLPLSLLWLW